MRLIYTLIVLLVLSAPAQAKDIRVDDLIIDTQGGAQAFRVEIADTPEARQRGLMFRQDLGAREGMLFDFKHPQRVSFWMKDTPLYLDMLFIDASGMIVGITADVEPYTTETRPSPGPVLAVLELLGGAAARFGIRPGDTVRHPIFGNQP